MLHPLLSLLMEQSEVKYEEFMNLLKPWRSVVVYERYTPESSHSQRLLKTACHKFGNLVSGCWLALQMW